MNLAYLATCFFGSTDDIWMLRDSAARFGIDLKLYGLGKAFLPGFIEIKIIALLPELETLQQHGYTHVLYTDGPDTFFVKGPAAIESEYAALGAPPWLISAETSCYPHTALGPLLPLDKRCPNTGQYMGEISTILNGWNKLKTLYDDGTDNEQGWIIRGIVDGHLSEVTIDMGRRIFRSEADNYTPEMSGCALHFNGGYWNPGEGKRSRMRPVWERVCSI